MVEEELCTLKNEFKGPCPPIGGLRPIDKMKTTLNAEL
jgi:hypothetical protein